MDLYAIVGRVALGLAIAATVIGLIEMAKAFRASEAEEEEPKVHRMRHSPVRRGTTRWPLDLDERLELAELDVDFVAAMRRIGCRDRSLARIEEAAYRAVVAIDREQQDRHGGA